MERFTLPSGTTIRLLLSACRCPREYLTSWRAIAPLLEAAVRSCEMAPLAVAGHDFPGAGQSTCLILAESHLALHTYPEYELTTIVELSVCDHQRPNRERAHRLAAKVVALFEPARYVLEEAEMLPRGAWRA